MGIKGIFAGTKLKLLLTLGSGGMFVYVAHRVIRAYLRQWGAIPDYFAGIAAKQIIGALILYAKFTIDNEKIRRQTGIGRGDVGEHGGTVCDGCAPIFRAIGPQSPNPFINRTAIMGPAQRLKMALVGAVLLPLRCCIFVPAFLLMALSAWTFGAAGLSDARLEKPLPRLRRFLRDYLAHFFFRCAMFGLGFHWVERDGAPRASTQDAALVVPNHSSFVDMGIGCVFHATGVSKAENKHVPLMGPAFRGMQAIMVDRDDPRSREATKATLKRRGEEPGWMQTVIFPEGTCSNRSTLLMFKAGAFAAGVGVQPVAVAYPHAHCDPSLVRVGPQLGALALRLCCQLHNRVRLRVLPVQRPTPAEQRDALAFAARVRRAMAEALGHDPDALSKHSFYDVLLMTRAKRRLRLPVGRVVPEFKRVREVLPRLTPGLAVALLDRFARLHANAPKDAGRARKAKKKGPMLSGELSRREVGACLAGSGLDDADVDRLFALGDEEARGAWRFRQFLVVVLLLGEAGAAGALGSAAAAFALRVVGARAEADVSDATRRRVLGGGGGGEGGQQHAPLFAGRKFTHTTGAALAAKLHDALVGDVLDEVAAEKKKEK